MNKKPSTKKKVFDPKWSQLGIATQYMHVFELARANGNVEGMLNAAKNIEELSGIYISMNPTVVIGGRDLNTATVEELLLELEKRSLGMIVCLLRNDGQETYHKKVKGHYHLLCGLTNHIEDMMTRIRREHSKSQKWKGSDEN